MSSRIRLGGNAAPLYRPTSPGRDPETARTVYASPGCFYLGIIVASVAIVSLQIDSLALSNSLRGGVYIPSLSLPYKEHDETLL